MSYWCSRTVSPVKDVAELLNEMCTKGIIKNYAIFGAVAQMRYTEAVSTLDADVLVALPEESGLDLLSPIYAFCKSKGYQPEGEAIRIGDWPVQFIPVFDDLTRKAMEEAETADLDGAPLRVVRADHLALMALKTGRTKDHMRIEALLEAKAITPSALDTLSVTHGLTAQWNAYKERYL